VSEPDRHRAVRAALAVAHEHGVRCRDPQVLADGSNLILRLAPAPVVARVATTTLVLRPDVARFFARDVAVAGYLSERGAPVVPPADELPPGPHQRDGLAITFWRYAELDPDRAAPTPAMVGRMLAELHVELRSYPGELLLLGPPLRDIERFVARRDGWPVMAPGDAAAVRDAFDRVRAALPTVADPRPLHGDAHPHNLLGTRSGWRWTDFEDACAGPLAWDLACLASTRRLDGERAVACHGYPVDPAELAAYRELRKLHLTVWTVVASHRRVDYRDRARELLDDWRRPGVSG
jgi:hypothetical protein